MKQLATQILFFLGGAFYCVLHNPLSAVGQSGGIDEGVAFEIRHWFEAEIPSNGLDFFLFNSDQVNRFYAGRHFAEAWIQDGLFTCNAYELRYQIQQSRYDGLKPEEYHLDRIDGMFVRMEQAAKSQEQLSPLELAQIDMTLSDAFIELGSHLYVGKVDPSHSDFGWELRRKEPKDEVLRNLERAVDGCEVRKSLEAFYPNFPMYKRMRQGIRLYHEKAKVAPKKWEVLQLPKSVKPLESHAIIPKVRQRLDFWEGVETLPAENQTLYDSLLLDRVKRYQSLVGLNPDGVIGNSTLRALNKTPQDLIRQAGVNMERLRWLPDTTLSEMVLVNIANFSMDYIRDRDTLLHSNAIVGKAYRKTPVFNAPMTYLVFSPTWTVPPTILRNDVLPAVRKDIGYLRSKKMRVLTYSGKEVDPTTIDWSKVSASNFPYMVRQDPGPSNSLGWVKFMFPNKHNVYIHDTPSRDLFARDDRALSSGCIRIEKPLDFARLLLADQPLWSDDRIRAAMYGGKEQTVMLKRQIPVVIIYLTYWADSLGVPQVRHDLYDRDNHLYAAMSRPMLETR